MLRTLRVLAVIALLVAGYCAATSGLLPIAPGAAAIVVPRYAGSPAVARPINAPPVPQHPYLAEAGRNSMHNDAYASDAYPYPGPLGHRPQLDSWLLGVEECATLTFTRDGRLLGLCGDPRGPQLRLFAHESMHVLARHRLPGRSLRPGVSPLEDLCGGAYMYLGSRDRAVVATTNRQVHVVAVGERALIRERVYDLAGEIPEDDCLIALLPDWSGLIWFVTGEGRVGTIEPVSGEVHIEALAGERIVNSFAADESGGVYIVSDHALYRFAVHDGAPVTTWRQPYDRGTQRKPGQLSQGSGTTPTLLGPDLIAITDNAEPRMRVRFFERVTGRPICSAEVFAAGASATENSLVAVGSGVIVENNYGYTGPLSTMFGNTTSPGVARVDVVDGECVTAWTSDEVVAPTSVPKASLATGLLYVYSKPSRRFLDTWYVTAIDVHTGDTVWRRLTGVGAQWNNHYAAITLGPDGSLYIATLTGLLRVRDSLSGFASGR